MKVETQFLEDHQALLKIEADAQKFNQAKQQAARKLAQRVKIPGFRPGKAPYALILRQVGEANVIEEAVEILANELYPQALDEAGIKPYGPGQLENVVSVDPLVLEFKVPLEEVVVLGDYQAVRVDYNPPAITEEQINESIAELQQRQAIVEPVDRPAQEGDQVQVRLNGHRLEVAEDEEAALISNRLTPVVIEPEAKTNVYDFPFPGFSRLLIGKSKGDEVATQHTFPEDSPYESLRGITAEFTGTIEGISQRTLPELNDEFAKTVSEFDTFAELRHQVEHNLEHAALDNYHKEYDEQIMTSLLETADIKYPPQLLEREMEQLMEDFKHRLEHQGLDIDTYYKLSEKTEADLQTELRETAIHRLRRALATYEVGKLEQIKISQAEAQQATISTLEYLNQSMPEDQKRLLSQPDAYKNLVNNIMADLLSTKITERLRLIAQGKQVESEAVPSSDQDETVAEDEEIAVEALPAASLVVEDEPAEPSTTSPSEG